MSEKKSTWPEIDALLEAMWQASKARKGLTPGRRAYNYARTIYIRDRRAAIEDAAEPK